jgi:hypothetical protein
MEKVVCNVAEIDNADRRALEHVIGMQLSPDHQVIINVVNRDLSESGAPDAPTSEGIPSWWNVYEGLSDEQIDEFDQAIRKRANFSRVFEELMDPALLNSRGAPSKSALRGCANAICGTL